MQKVFFGNPIKHKVDEKHRVSIPASFRELLGDNRIIFTNYVARHLVRCYPEENYMKKGKEMLKRPEDDKERQIFFLAERYELDDQGRIVVKGPMNELEEVIFAANGDVFDIWNPNEFPYKDHIIE